MTPVSITVSGAAALLCGLIGGRCLRGFRGGNAKAHAIAAVVGRTLLRTTLRADPGRIIQPQVASDWLPLFCILVAGYTIIRPWGYRAAFRILLAVLMPIRLLWGSVYLPSEHWEGSIFPGLAAWSAALAVPVFVNDNRSGKAIS